METSLALSAVVVAVVSSFAVGSLVSMTGRASALITNLCCRLCYLLEGASVTSISSIIIVALRFFARFSYFGSAEAFCAAYFTIVS